MIHWLATLTRSSRRAIRSSFIRTYTLPFDGDFQLHGKRIFREHYARARVLAPEPGKLLEYRISEGWGPLCGFLDLPVPEEAFPNGNGEAVARGRFRALAAHEAALVWGVVRLWIGGLGLVFLVVRVCGTMMG